MTGSYLRPGASREQCMDYARATITPSPVGVVDTSGKTMAHPSTGNSHDCGIQLDTAVHRT